MHISSISTVRLLLDFQPGVSKPGQASFGGKVTFLLAAELDIVRPHMGESPRRSWIYTAVLLGIGYALVGIVCAVPATQMRAWRLAAWVVSAAGYAAHITYERFRLHNSPGTAALHIAFAVALGAFGLAVGANVHSMSTSSTNQHRQLLLLALGIWPVITALPAFLVALGINVALKHALANSRSM